MNQEEDFSIKLHVPHDKIDSILIQRLVNLQASQDALSLFLMRALAKDGDGLKIIAEQYESDRKSRFETICMEMGIDFSWPETLALDPDK